MESCLLGMMAITRGETLLFQVEVYQDWIAPLSSVQGKIPFTVRTSLSLTLSGESDP